MSNPLWRPANILALYWTPEYLCVVSSCFHKISKVGKDLWEHVVQLSICHPQCPINHVPQFHISTLLEHLPGAVTPPPLWAAWATASLLFQRRCSWCLTWTSPNGNLRPLPVILSCPVLSLIWNHHWSSCFGSTSSLLSILLSSGINPALVSLPQYLYLRKDWVLFCWQFFWSSSLSHSSPVLCTGLCIMLPCPSQRWMPVHGYKRFLPAAQLCPFPSWLPAAGTAQWKSAHPSRILCNHTSRALCSNKMIRDLVFALVNVIWKLHAENVPLSRIWRQ